MVLGHNQGRAGSCQFWELIAALGGHYCEKIRFSLPPVFSLAGTLQRGPDGDTARMEIEWAMLVGGGMWKCSNNTNGLSYGEYIDMFSLYEMHSESIPAVGFTDRCRILIELCNTCGSSYTLTEHSKIHINGVVSHNLVSLYIFTPSTKSPLARITLFHEFPLDSIWILSFFPKLTEHGWRYTWRQRWGVDDDALWGFNRLGLNTHLETMIQWKWRSTWRFWLWWRSIWKQWIGSEVQLELRLYTLLN